MKKILKLSSIISKSQNLKGKKLVITMPVSMQRTNLSFEKIAIKRILIIYLKVSKAYNATEF